MQCPPVIGRAFLLSFFNIMTTAIIYPLYRVKRLEEICFTEHGVIAPKSSYTASGKQIPYIRSSDIDGKNINSVKASISQEAVLAGNIKLVQGNNILIAVTGTNAGKIAMLDQEAAIDSTVIAVINHHKVNLDTSYLYYYLSGKISSLLKISHSGIRISDYRLGKLEIMMPSLRQQTMVVQRIEAQLKDVDALIGNLKVLANELDNKKEQVLENAFKKIAGSEYTKKIKITVVAKVQPGLTPSQSIPGYYGSAFPLFKPSDTAQGKEMQASKIMLSDRGIKIARLVPALSVLIVFAGNLLGKAGINRIPAACNGQMLAVIPFDTIVPGFIYYQLQSAYMQSQIKALSVNDVLTKAKFEELDFLHMPLKMQVQFVEELENNLNAVQEELSDIKASIDTALRKRTEIVKTIL